MSLATRCPACDTTFKVVRDQLRISDGWVRCGRCSQVFDATANLQELSDAPVAPAATVEDSAPLHSEQARATEAPVTEEPAQDHFSEDFLDDDHELVEQADRPGFESEAEMASEPAATTDGFGPAPEAVADPEPDLESDPEPETEASSETRIEPIGFEEHAVAPVHAPWPDADSLLLGDEGGRAAPRPPAPAPLSFPDIDLNLHASQPAASPHVREAGAVAGIEDSGFTPLDKALRRARVKSAKIAKANKAREQKLAAAADHGRAPVVQAASEAEAATVPAFSSPALGPVMTHFGDIVDGSSAASGFWARPSVRRAVVFACLLAALLLIVQVLHQQRDLIAARQPAMRPLLDQLCSVTGCQVSGLRQINDIKIDGASFARDRSGDGFQLSFTVRNAATVPLAMPAVELSLLDTQERAVVRRVLMPSEFGAPAVLPARGERAASLSLSLSGAEAAAMPPVAGFRIEALYP